MYRLSSEYAYPTSHWRNDLISARMYFTKQYHFNVVFPTLERKWTSVDYQMGQKEGGFRHVPKSGMGNGKNAKLRRNDCLFGYIWKFYGRFERFYNVAQLK